MNAKIKDIIATILIIITIFGIGFCTGFISTLGPTAKLETDISELSKRNKSISSRINDLAAASRRDAETSRILAEQISELNTGIGELSSGLTEQVRRSKSIADRSQRVAELARVLDKGITELISLVQKVQEDNNWDINSSSD